jgi:aminopeptidase N
VVPEPRPDGRLHDLARPRRYALSLDVDPSIDRFGGTQRIELSIAGPTRVLVLHARGLTIRTARVTSAGGAALVGAARSRAAAGGRGEPEELVLTFDREIPAGDATLEIGFDGAFNPTLRGIYRVRSGEDWYAFTQFEPNDARRAFPCFDEPGFKVPWELTLRVPRGQIAVANMPEAARTDEARTTLVRFAPTPPTSSYLVAFAVGPFDVVEGPRTPVPLRAITTRGQGWLTQLILDAAAAHVRILGEYFDRPFPYPKLDLVAVPEFGAGAMENPGLITFREELMLLDPARAPTSQRRAMASVLAHELAHHWFGDLVTMAWWNDLWLNEGFATWMQARVVDQWQPAFRAQVEALRGRGAAMESDSLPAARAVRQPVSSTSDAVEAFDWITYLKGAAVLHMLEHWVGEDVFRDGIRQYVHENEWRNATADALFAALDRAARRDVSGAAATFLDRPGVPLVRVDLTCPPGAPPRVTVAQSRYRVALASAAAERETEPAAWRIPVCLLFEAEGGPRRTCVELQGASTEAPLEGAARCPRWVHPNADEAGYYRYAITPPVRALVTSGAARGLDVRGRAGLVDDAWALVRGGELGADEFLRLLEAFRGERERVVLESIAGALQDLFADVADDATGPALQAWIASFLRPVARELGWDPRPGEDDERKLLRRLVLGTMGAVANDAVTLAEAERRAQDFLRDPRSVDADVAAVALPLASRRADAARLDALLAALRTAPTPADRAAILGALAAFEEPALLRRALDATLTDAVRVQDILRLIYAAAGHPARRATVVAWVQEHFDGIQTRLPGDPAGRLAGLARVACSPAEVAQAEAFWRPRAPRFEGAERALREGLQRADQCIALRDRERPRLASFFAPRRASR